jgi:hypothetical protein
MKTFREEMLGGKWVKVKTALSGIVIIIIMLCSVFSSFQAADRSLKLSTAESINLAYGMAMKHEKLRDPSSEELMKFLANDTTDQLNYTKKFNCVNFSAMMVSHALAAGWRCAFVQMWFEFAYIFVREGHVMVAFNLTDYGLVFVEPQSDTILPPMDKGDETQDRTIHSLDIYWFG